MARRKYGRRKKIFRRKKYGGRRLFKRRRMGRSNGNSLMRITGSNPVAQRTIVTLKYCQDFGLSVPNTLAPVNVNFNLNSLFAPWFTVIGHQPYGFDTYALLYNHYRVWRCKWRVEMSRVSSGDTRPVMGNVLPLNDALHVPTTWAELAERPRSVSKMLHAAYSGPAHSPPTVFKGSIGLPFLAGVTRQTYADDRFSALSTASPAEILQLVVSATKLFGTAETVQCTITMWFTAEFFDPIELAQS